MSKGQQFSMELPFYFGNVVPVSWIWMCREQFEDEAKHSSVVNSDEDSGNLQELVGWVNEI